jgi:hypothetical protein
MLVSMSRLFYRGNEGKEGSHKLAFGDKELQWKRPRLFWPCLTLLHHPSLVILKKQAVPDIRRDTERRKTKIETSKMVK